VGAAVGAAVGAVVGAARQTQMRAEAPLQPAARMPTQAAPRRAASRWAPAPHLAVRTAPTRSLAVSGEGQKEKEKEEQAAALRAGAPQRAPGVLAAIPARWSSGRPPP
jgi:hypothetical protein